MAVTSWERAKRFLAQHRSKLDFEQESMLDESNQPASSAFAATAGPIEVLLTGASGYLGLAILHELLDDPRMRISCLVRCKSPDEGLARLQAGLQSRGLNKWVPTLAERVKVVPGDLAKFRLGLDESIFASLGSQVDVIYHVGAQINILLPYVMLAAANVRATEDILRLAGMGRTSTVHYVSTAAILMRGRGESCEIFEDAPLEEPPAHGFGYIHSKWIAEKLLARARERGFPIDVYRPTIIGWDSVTGISNPADFSVKLIRECVGAGLAPDLDIMLDIVPVDHVARAIVAIARQSRGSGKCYHVSSPRPVRWTEVIEMCERIWGPLRRQTYESWFEDVSRNVRSELHRIGPALPDPQDPGHIGLMHLLERQAYPVLRRDNLIEGLNAAKMALPELDEDLLRKFARARTVTSPATHKSP